MSDLKASLSCWGARPADTNLKLGSMNPSTYREKARKEARKSVATYCDLSRKTGKFLPEFAVPANRDT